MKKEVKIILVSCLFVIVNFSIRSGTTIHGESFIGQTFKAGSFSYEVISKNEVLVYKYDHRERVCQDDFCKFSKFKYLSAEKSPNISCLHIS